MKPAFARSSLLKSSRRKIGYVTLCNNVYNAPFSTARFAATRPTCLTTSSKSTVIACCNNSVSVSGSPKDPIGVLRDSADMNYYLVCFGQQGEHIPSRKATARPSKMSMISVSEVD